MTPSFKGLFGQSLFASRLDTILLRNTAVVVAFHRVKDGADISDSLTIDTRTFEEYCRFFRREFRVVSLPDLVRKLETGQTLNRELVITFDDGYRDNFENAVPVLEKLSVPASFFVVTQWTGTNIVPFWDQQVGTPHPWMTWDQVQSLSRRGFDIGAHTRTHVDLGKVSTSLAHDEIVGARFDLEQKLGVSVESFAYPYGGRTNITDTTRELVRAAGFRCCCGGFGGEVSSSTDPFRLPRVPISSWYDSPHQFGFDVALGRSLDPV